MLPVKSDELAHLMFELYFESRKDLGLLEPLDQVPFQIQQRKMGFTPAMRCLSMVQIRPTAGHTAGSAGPFVVCP